MQSILIAILVASLGLTAYVSSTVRQIKSGLGSNVQAAVAPQNYSCQIRVLSVRTETPTGMIPVDRKVFRITWSVGQKFYIQETLYGDVPNNRTWLEHGLQAEEIYAGPPANGGGSPYFTWDAATRTASDLVILAPETRIQKYKIVAKGPIYGMMDNPPGCGTVVIPLRALSIR